MTRDRAKRLFHALLVSATGAAATLACGGSVTTIGNSEEQNPTSGDTGDRQADARPPIVRHDADTHSPDAAVDAPADTRSDVVVTQGCVNGVLDPSAALCCATPGDPACGPSGGGDGDCQLDCRKVCGLVAPGVQGGFQSCYWGSGTSSGKIQYLCGACGVGRIPSDVAPCGEGSTVAERLAMQAYYESASVVAFERLAATLETSGAPASLIARARGAAVEERAHAELFDKLARDRGASAMAPSFADRTPSLDEIALENATEGCVRETYGALLALHQSVHAEDPELRAAYATVAADEIDHAALSWELTAWLEERAAPLTRARIIRARRTAQRDLRRALDRRVTPVERAIGLPERDLALSMLDAILRAAPALSEAA